MAPSRYRGSRCRDFGVDVLRSNDYYPEHHDWQRIQGWDLQNDIRQRNGKEGDDGHEQYPYFLGTCNPNASSRQMQKLGWCSRTLMDREPGELSGGSRSGIEDEVKKSEGEDDASSRKKRKFSPISRDLDDKKKNSVLHSKIINAEWERSALPSPPALLRVSHDPTLVKRIKISEDLSPSLDQKASVSSVQYWQLKNGDEPEKMEEADCGPVRTISFSRWADANYAIEHDEGVSSDVEILTNSRENSPLASAQDQRTVSGEVIVGEGSEESASYASVSCGLYREVHIELVEDMIDDLYVQGGKGNVKENDGSIGTYTMVEGRRVETLETVKPPCRRISMLQGCRSVDEFEKLNKINEGTYGIVYRARDTKTGEIVALKKVKMEKEREGFPLTSLREINILLSVHHPSIVEVKEVVVGGNLDGIFTVMEYMDHDLKGLMKTMKKPFHLSEVKCLMLQLLSGVKHLHDNWILHRDLKASNLLFNNCGELKICDFGLSRQYGSPLKPYTQLVVTLWYRAPELLLGAEKYSTAIDMWSLGCIMAELLAKEPLFPGKSELDQLDKIFRVLGTPDEKIWPGFTRLPGAKANFTMKSSKLHEKFPRMSPASFLGRTFLSNAGFDLLNKLLTYDPEKRLTAVEALNHPWFLESPLPTSKDFMPTFPAQHAQNRHQKRIIKGPDPQDLLRQGIDNS